MWEADDADDAALANDALSVDALRLPASDRAADLRARLAAASASIGG